VFAPRSRSDRFDAGLNEAIAARLARPTRVMGEDDRSVDIQIVYGDVPSAMSKFTEQDKPLLAYSWLPRAEVPGNYARITLESFYHCGDEGESTPLATPIDREVTACDFPIEHVEKAVVWRLQQPSSTTAALFVNAFNLNAAQLNRLLEIGDDLNLARDSVPSEAELDHAACLWLNSNTDTWEAWLPDFDDHDSVLFQLLFQWEVWLIVCVLTSLGGAVIGFLLLRRYENLSTKAEDELSTTKYSSWPDLPGAKHLLVSCVGCLGCCKLINAGRWDPVLEYLGNAIFCLWNPKESKYRSKTPQDDKNRWHYRYDLILFGFGQLFVGASVGFFENLIYNTWLTNGLNQLSLEVTISCAAWMLALKLFKWGFKSLPSGEKVVRRQLQIRLRIKCKELKIEDIKETAKTLASNCYGEAWNAFSEFLGFLSAIGFLFYYLFNKGPPQGVSYLVIVAFVLAPVWLSIVLVFGPLLKKRSPKIEAKVSQSVSHYEAKIKAKLKGKTQSTRTADETSTTSTNDDEPASSDAPTQAEGATSAKGDEETYPSYKRTYSGILWTCVYVLWAFGPILINPLKNDLSTGTNFVPLEDLLTVVMVVSTMGSSLIDLEGHLSTMAQSSSKATAVAKLLKGEKPEGQAAEASRVIAEANAYKEKVEAEAEAKADQIIAEAMAYKEKAEAEVKAIKDLAEMAKNETSALTIFIADAKQKAEADKQKQTTRWYHPSYWFSSSS